MWEWIFLVCTGYYQAQPVLPTWLAEIVLHIEMGLFLIVFNLSQIEILVVILCLAQSFCLLE